MKHILFILLLVTLLNACSNNLDSQCADFYTNVNEEMDKIIYEKDKEKRAKLISELDSFEETFAYLKIEANKRYEEKLASGELPIPIGKLKIDDLSIRKSRALNGFADRRWKIEHPPQILKEMMGFTLMCNQYLR